MSIRRNYIIPIVIILVLFSPTVNNAVGTPSDSEINKSNLVQFQSEEEFKQIPTNRINEHSQPSYPRYSGNILDSGNQIIMFDNFKYRDQALDNLGTQEIHHVYNYIPAFVISAEGLDISNYDGVRSVTPDMKFQSTASPSEVFLDDLIENAFSLNETAQMVGVDVLRKQYGLTGEGKSIAVLDSGINKSLESFDNVNLNVIPELSPTGSSDQDGHGTHVSGIIGSNGMYYIDGKWQQTGSYGMAPEASIQSIRVLDETGFGDNSWILEGMEMAISMEVDVISMSLSTVVYEGPNDPMKAMAQRAAEEDILIVAAAGNTGPIGSAIGIPAAFQDVIAVGASFPRSVSDLELWSFSGVGPAVNGYPGADVIAPGARIISVNAEDGGFTQLSGTSMATPHVSGGIALLKQAFPSASNYQIREALLASSQISINSQDLIDQIEGQGRGHVRFDLAYEILENSIQNPDTHVQMPIIPNIIQDRNYIYNHRLMGENKTLPFFLHSSRNISITPVVNNTFSDGLTFHLPEKIEIYEGINRINITLEVTADRVRKTRAQLYFMETNTSKILPNAYIYYDTESRYIESKILFDTAHDGDTAGGYFGNHGPMGQYSQMAKSLEEQGHVVHESGNMVITSDLLDNYDLLVIANPDREYNTSEVEAITNFVESDGKSILMIVGGGLLSAEGEPTYPDFNREGLVDILSPSGISIPSDSDTPFSLTPCDFADTSFDGRLQGCLSTARFTRSQMIFEHNKAFPHFGPELSVSAESTANILAYSGNSPVAASSELDSNGRYLVFSSPLVFDNSGILYDYTGPHTAVGNEKILHKSIDWLLEPRQAKMEVQINSISNQQEYELNMHQRYEIILTPKDKDGNVVELEGNPESIMVDTKEVIPEGSTGYFGWNFTKVDDLSGSYSFVVEIPINVIISFYYHLQVDNSISTDSHFVTIFQLKNYENQPIYRRVALVSFVLIAISWMAWIKNEGGRDLWNIRKREEN